MKEFKYLHKILQIEFHYSRRTVMLDMDLRKKWFAFPKMDITTFSLLKQLKNENRKSN